MMSWYFLCFNLLYSGYDSEDEEKEMEGEEKQKKGKEVEEKEDLDYTEEWADDEQQEEVILYTPPIPASPSPSPCKSRGWTLYSPSEPIAYHRQGLWKACTIIESLSLSPPPLSPHNTSLLAF